ncbi:hypothetical protein ACM66Z_10880 [Sulfurovum sp. ST-21]|uniref:Uncharacterized protein n=1 Tax=Sulfurovum indicum TaxID=2779528 RepID=A0A7M1S1E3_9BACT|nr:hypothetical protein [Sulfurovum indicum]QOR61176.1 hypothetical protein IMZ28_06850 [Sulfurovum indicum]QOR61898.1 hypothetical protein IMZ28_10865 [Sulfurovum indicum]
MKTSKDFLSSVSNHIYSQITMYQFNKNTITETDKYREGRLTALKYASELAYYFLQIEKNLPHQFKKQIDYQMKSNSCLLEGDYKRGLYDGLNNILDELAKLK